MLYVLAIAILVTQVLLVYVVFNLAQDVKQLRRHVESWARRAGPSDDAKNWLTSHDERPFGGWILSTQGRPPIRSYAIWVWKGQSWELDLSSVAVGFAPGPPPPFRGSFQGQRIKGECGPW